MCPAQSEGDIGEKLNSFMQNPEMMAKVMAAVRNLGGDAAGDEHSESEGPREEAEPDAKKMTMPVLQSSSNRSLALLQALRPFLSEERQKRADQILKMIRFVELAGHFQDFM